MSSRIERQGASRWVALAVGAACLRCVYSAPPTPPQVPAAARAPRAPVASSPDAGAELVAARDTAIARLEQFVARFGPAQAADEMRADALFRLASLYEERAHEGPKGDLATSSRPAIARLKGILRDCPHYREAAQVHHQLGYALDDAGRSAEAQQVWRSLVCKNHYAYPVPSDPADPEVDRVAPLPQDHPRDYWKDWRAKFPTPQALKKGGPDTRFVDPYPPDCEPVPPRPGGDAKYVAEVWWRIGEWEFDQLDLGGGAAAESPWAVYDLNRAASAYTHALRVANPAVAGPARYKYAWTLYKQQRYRAAARAFVDVLRWADEEEKRAGTPVDDYRTEAVTYVAGSLANVDFDGPGPDEPYIDRPDAIDTMAPAAAEKALHVAIGRVQDPQIVPQNEAWTIRVYRELADTFRGLNEYQNALDTCELVLKRWPDDPRAADTARQAAEARRMLRILRSHP